MYGSNLTKDYGNSFTKWRDNENDDKVISIKLCFLSIPGIMLWLCFIGLIKHTTLKPFISVKQMDKFLYPQHPVRCITIRPSERGRNCFLAKLILNNIIEFEKVYLYSPSLHQDLYRKLIICVSNYIPRNKIPSFLNGEDVNLVFDEMVNVTNFEKSDTKIDTFPSGEELKYPQENNSWIIILDDLNEKEMNDPRIQAIFKRLDRTIYLLSQSVRFITKYQRELSELMAISSISSKQTTSKSLSRWSKYGHDL